MPWIIRFSNPLDVNALEDAQVLIEPALPSGSMDVFHDTVEIQGRSAGRTRYTVTLSGSIRDIFGQTLGQDQIVTFHVGSADPVLWAPGGSFITLDPAGRPAYSVFTINVPRLQVRAYAVDPEDWPAFQAYLRDYDPGVPSSPPGKEVLVQTVDVLATADELAETAIDLGPALGGGKGHVIVAIKAEMAGLDAIFKSWRARYLQAQAWVQATAIGLDAFVDQDEMVAWANALADGTPIEGVEVRLLPDGAGATTDAGGLARLRLSDQDATILVGRQGEDVAMLPADMDYWGWSQGWQSRPLQDSLRWYVFDDRQIYRPGEEVHVKGWLRRIGAGPNGDVGLVDGAVSQVRYQVYDSRGNSIHADTVPINALGGFDFTFDLKDTMNLGEAQIQLDITGPGGFEEQSNFHWFQVQEFRRPEFEVTANASEGPHFVGSGADLTVAATYYAGGGLPNAEVTWRVRSAPGSYTPPNWDDFTFGTWIPWWQRWDYEPHNYAIPETLSGQTDAAGVHRLRIDFDAVDPPQPTNVTAEATVMDVNRQAWTAGALLLVHPADLYIGLHSDRNFVQRGEPLQIDAVVTDLDGNAVAGREIALSAVRLDWEYCDGQWQEVESDAQMCTTLSTSAPVRCTFKTPEGGQYRIAATVRDARGRLNRSELTRWVSGGQRPPARDVEQEEVVLIPDRASYQPGDTAEILVQAPFYPAEGLLTLRRSGLVRSERFRMDEASYTVRVPIEDGYVPNLAVQVDLVGAAPRTDDAGEPLHLPARPAFAMGSLNLSVPPLARALQLEVVPRDTRLEPGGTTVLDLNLRDASGQPVAGGELAVVVVDEAVLALTGYQVPDPVAVFYRERYPDVADHHLRQSVLLARPDDLIGSDELARGTSEVFVEVEKAVEAPAAPAPAAAEDYDEAAPAPIALRTDFNPLAVFAPAVPTDVNGHAEVEVRLPDSLTRYRVIAVGVAGGKQFGRGEAAITARLPLMVRPSPPRFLNFGDHFELAVVVQNQTEEPLEADVVVRGTNVELDAAAGQPVSAGRQVTVPADDRVEVRFPVAAARAGTTRFQVGAVSGPWADAAQFELPVWTPATTEAFAVYGELDEGVMAQPVMAPADAFTQFGGLEITTSSTALQALTDAVLYLVSYRFECSEQLASRILAVAALRDVLVAFEAEGLPPPAEIEAAVARDIQRLQGMQNYDGGFPVWRRGEESWPYHSIHVAHALQRAQEKGYDVPYQMMDGAHDYLRTIESHWPYWYSENARRNLLAYALYVRQLMGDPDAPRARRLVRAAGLENLSPEAIGWLLTVLSDDPASAAEVAEIRGHLNNRVTETAGTAHFVTSFGEDEGYLLLQSNMRADGVLLEALIGDQPDSDLIPKIVRGLLTHRTDGRWGNTQENVFILLALDRYFRAYEKVTPDFVARVWLGDRYAGEVAFQGRTTDSHRTDVPMAYLAQAGTQPQDLILSKEGPGRLYYRLGLRYAPTDLWLEPADYGFSVERTYEAVDDPEDVYRDAEGVWHVAAGARVRVRLSLVAPARRYHVALADPLPAGFEALNPELAVTGALPEDPESDSGGGWWWWRNWYEHENLRDQRAEAFASLLWEGVYRYTYLARATTLGDFVVPPARAEEMYAPETFGRSASDRVVVEEGMGR
jgi:uncharacterized protein YfaS (alpha-2-macroglobulin family)